MSTQSPKGKKRVRIETLRKMMQDGEKIAVVTAYDYTSTLFCEQAGVDVLLVGDSMGMVIQGHDSTLPVTLEESLYHTKIVARHAARAMVIGDMPFMTYQTSIPEAIANAGRYIKEAGAQAVKLEGGVAVKDTIAALVNAQIPVMAHVGMTPQSVNLTSGYKPQREIDRIVSDALACQNAGAFSIVLECVSEEVSNAIVKELSIPTIGIGASAHCAGQVLVYHDLLGLFEDFTPKFVKKYADLAPTVRAALTQYVKEVKSGAFPGSDNVYH